MTYLPIRDAAHRLSMSEEALQTFCRRRARKRGKDTVAELPDGIVALKFERPRKAGRRKHGMRAETC